MSKAFHRFEDIQAWQKARLLVNDIYDLFLSERLSREFVLRDQLIRAGISAMTNIAEGFSRSTDKDFAHFLDIAAASATEVQSLLYILKGRNFVNEEQFKECHSLATEVGAMCHGLRRYLRS